MTRLIDIFLIVPTRVTKCNKTTEFESHTERPNYLDGMDPFPVERPTFCFVSSKKHGFAVSIFLAATKQQAIKIEEH